MTLYQFNALDEMAQIEAFWNGVLVGEVKAGEEHTMECRQIDDFYVEYLKRDGRFVDMRSFRNPDLLERYWDGMGEVGMH